MPLNDRLASVLDWLRAGYPAGVPPKDYIPLLALLRRRLTENEVAAIVTELSAAGAQIPSAEAIGVSITKITDALPTPEDIARVEAQLTSTGSWPSDDA